MARLIRGALVFVALATLCVGASAEPISTFLASTAFTTAAGAAISYGAVISAIVTVASVVSSVYGSMQAKKQARRSAERKFQEDVANLRDRTTTIVAGDDAWTVVYGQPAPIGGSVKAVVTSGDKDQFKHIVLVLAAHECEAIDDVLIDGESLQLNAYGTSQHPAYQLEYGIARDITYSYTVQDFSWQSALTGEIQPVYAAVIDTSADGQYYSPQLIKITDSAGTDITGSGALALGNRLTVPQHIHNVGFCLVAAGPEQVGLTGQVTVRVDGPGSAVHVSKHLSRGGVDFVDPILRGAKPDLWTDNHKLTGYTYLVITINLLLERFQGGLPAFTARVRGKRVFDPRTGTTYYSRNPAICLADFLRSEAGYLALPEQIDENALIAAANACDQVVYGEGAWGDNDTRLYTCDGMFRTDQDRDTTRQQIEEAMAGYSLESGGVWRILAGAWTTPVMALTDADLLGPVVAVQTCNPGTQRYNGARGSYVNQARSGVTEDYTPYQNAVFRAADAKDKFLDLALTFTGSHARTHQIARTLVEQSRGGFILQINPKMSAWHLQPGDRITLSSGIYGFTNKYFRIQEWTYSTTSPLSFQIIEDEPSFYDLADAAVADPAPNTNLPSPFLRPEPPLDLDVVSGASQVVVQGGSVVVRAHVTWSQSPSPAVRMGGYVRVQWRTVSPVSDWVTTDLPGDAVETYLLGLNVNSEYQVRVRFTTPYVSSDWSMKSHTLRGVSEIPGDVDGLSVTLEATGAIARWSAPVGMEQLDWGGTQIRVGDTWETAVDRFAGKALIANIGWLPSGTVKIWAAHFNAQGAPGVPISTTIDIEAPGQPIVSGEAWSQQVELSWQDCHTSQPISTYLIKVGATLEEAVEIGRTPALNFVKTETAGTRIYWVIAYDAGGNAGAAGYDEVQALPSIELALEELQEDLDEQIADLLNVNSGISERLLDESIARGTAITHVENLVTDGDEQLAERIDIVSARAVGYVRGNLVRNGGFEFDLEDWTTSVEGWEIVEDDWGTSARLIEGIPSTGWIASPKFPAKPGTWFAVSGDSKFLSAGSSGFAIEFFHANGATLGTTSNLLEASHDFLNEQARRNELAVEVQAPAGTASGAAVWLWTGHDDNNEVGIRYIKAEQGRFPVTPYSSEASDRGTVAAVREEAAARADAVSAEASARLTLAARVNDAEASLAEEKVVRADQTGKLFARWGLKMTVDGKVSGIILNNDGSESNATFLVDRFAIATQGPTGVTKYPFVVGSVAGAATVGIDGNLVVDGSIQARALFVDRLSAITARLGYVTAGQIDISGDGVGGWGFVRSYGKWRDESWGWVLARHTNGSTLIDFNLNGCGIVMHHDAGVSANFHMWGPGFDLSNNGLIINQIDVIDTLSVRGNAITVPTAAASPGSSAGIWHQVPAIPNRWDSVPTFITATSIMPAASIGILQIKINEALYWQGGALQGATVTGSVKVDLPPGNYWITAVNTVGGNSTSIFALSTRR
ncbi:hypothetical protein J7E62_02790 [Variovorax paradoxus]|nr:hypothetical protein [Variovorax paradoxus]